MKEGIKIEDNKTAYGLLGLLHHEPMSGYDLRKRIEAGIGRFWDAGYGQIYPALKAMTQAGLLSVARVPGGNRPAKKVYAVTAAGEKALIDWLQIPAAKEYLRYEILLKLFFGSLIPRQQNVKTIEAFRDRYLGEREILAAFEEELRRVQWDSPDHLYYLLTVLFGRRVYQAYLDWAEEAIRLLGGAREQ